MCVICCTRPYQASTTETKLASNLTDLYSSPKLQEEGPEKPNSLNALTLSVQPEIPPNSVNQNKGWQITQVKSTPFV